MTQYDEIQQLSANTCFGGQQYRFSHNSSTLGCSMTFSVFLPSADKINEQKGAVPALYWLSGLTCTDENFVHKAGAQRVAAELGMALVVPDTSPRGDEVADAPDGAYDLGLGAGFYVNATREPWRRHYQMYDYVRQELPDLISREFPVDPSRCSISGHSMGGHGALVIGLSNPDLYRSISAFAPICAPSRCPWGQKALSNYLGEDRRQWLQYDASALMADASRQLPLLVDQGDRDQFLREQLMPERLLTACDNAGYPLQYKLRPGYDHSYFYIASFIEEHLRFHHAALS